MTTMASSTTLALTFKISPSSIATRRLLSSHRTVHLSPFTKKTSLSLTSSQRINGFGPIQPQRLRTVASPSQKPQSLTIVCAKGYKMKTHKSSAKRFRVTGSGKIMRRRAGKQHLLRKKNTRRRVRLSKMVQVDRSDYDNVIGALPYLKVNRQK
ncbi:50S ribosomal protein [Actinidia chinensis var. chinensis]|uniref:50S ribosomal protein L35 n=1 Tax=Actinidia chinensis var. chinensis TaxID=1590841 RepID=A0A2R6R4W2_ACTCC|nr:50S ribosomal protein [Actinidia chinensis var. chinensis]